MVAASPRGDTSGAYPPVYDRNSARRIAAPQSLSDYDVGSATLLIRESKFQQSRLLPLNGGITGEMNRYLHARDQRKLPVSPNTALIWSAISGGRAYSGRHLRHCMRQLFRQCSIFNSKGRLPRIHDARHSFAVNALLRWYREGAERQSQASPVGHLHGARFHSVHPLLLALDRAAPNGRRRKIRPPLRRAGRVCTRPKKRAPMKKKLPNLLGAIMRDYFTDHLPHLRGMSRHTIQSYRDSLVLLLRFLSRAGTGHWRNST